MRKERRFPKRKDVMCKYCLTEFRVYGNVEASNSPYRKKYGMLLRCPRCTKERTAGQYGFSKCKEIIPV